MVAEPAAGSMPEAVPETVPETEPVAEPASEAEPVAERPPQAERPARPAPVAMAATRILRKVKNLGSGVLCFAHRDQGPGSRNRA